MTPEQALALTKTLVDDLPVSDATIRLCDVPTQQCSVDDCIASPHKAGLCSPHYYRKRRTGTTDVLTYADRFWQKVTKTDTCWLWTGATQREGYGLAVVAKRTQGLAHRFAYELLVGPIPDGLVLDHTCRVRACVNPAHLEPVTQQENVQRWSRTVTHCPDGHEYTPENTYTYRGSRHCRRCSSARANARKKRLWAARSQ